MLYNKDRALSLMQENSLEAIIATTHENVTYLTGHVGWAQRVYRQRKSCALLTKDPGTGTDLIMNRADNTYYAAYGGYAENVYSYGGQAYHIGQENYEPDNVEFEKYLELHNSGGENATLLDGLIKALKNRGISSGNIALDEEGCSESLFTALEKEFPNCNFLAASGLFLMIRLVKTEEELKVLREAASINENAIQQVFNFVKEGVTENEVAEVWRQAVAQPGAMWHWFHFNSGHRSVFIFPPTDKKLENGDLFMFDAGLFYKNYNK